MNIYNNGLPFSSRSRIGNGLSIKEVNNTLSFKQKKKHESSKISFALTALACLGLVGLCFKKPNVVFNEGRATIKKIGKYFSGCLKIKDCILTYENGFLKKSVKKGENGFVKKYIYDNGKLQKVIKDETEINTAKISQEIKEKLQKIEIYKEELNKNYIAYNNAKNASNSLITKYKLCNLQISKYEIQLKLDDIQFENKKLDVNQRANIEEKLNKTKKLKEFLYEKINNSKPKQKLKTKVANKSKIKKINRIIPNNTSDVLKVA